MISPRASDDHLLEGDCLDVLPQIEASSIDLIYLDPPFNTGRVHKGSSGASFDDRFPSIDDYIGWLRPRVEACRNVLKDTGSIYLHCDPTASHYIKVMMDSIFGQSNFRNEVIWAYRTGGSYPQCFARNHNTILFYAMSKKHTFNLQKERSYNRDNKPYKFKGVREYQDEAGRWYTMASMRDVWELNALGRTSRERVGYPTQKPVALLERIIKASSNEDDLVLDPFCGSGTTCVAAQRLGRRYIGIDKSPDAIEIAGQRLESSLI